MFVDLITKWFISDRENKNGMSAELVYSVELLLIGKSGVGI